MVGLGRDAGLPTVALLTDMATPLGRTAGNALEVAESVEVLAGGGPPDVVELTVALAREMLAAAGRDDLDPAEVLASGAAMDAWRAMIQAQGGDPDAALPTAREVEVVTAEADGVLQSLDAMAVGLAAWRLGAGRSRPGEAGPGRRRASSCTPSPATAYAPVSRCSACTPTPRSGSPRAPAGARGRVHDRRPCAGADSPRPRPDLLSPLRGSSSTSRLAAAAE